MSGELPGDRFPLVIIIDTDRATGRAIAHALTKRIELEEERSELMDLRANDVRSNDDARREAARRAAWIQADADRLKAVRKSILNRLENPLNWLKAGDGNEEGGNET